jgi:hypothetical protein
VTEFVVSMVLALGLGAVMLAWWAQDPADV